MNSSNKHDIVPDWSLQLTEQLISPPPQAQQQQQATDTTNKAHISNLPPSAMIVHQTPDDEQFENYIDRQFTSRDAKLLKNRLSEATTLRNSSTIPAHDWKDIEKTIPKAQQQQQQQQQEAREEGARPHPYHHYQDQDDQQSEESHVWWVTKNDQDGFYSICGLLFVFGFLFPPFWWIGSVWPRHVREKGGKMADRWQKLNRIMSIGFSSILIILIIVFVVLYATGVY